MKTSINKFRTGIFFAISLLMFMMLGLDANSQEISNIRVSQEGNKVKVMYDLTGTNETFNVNLFYSADDGKTWVGPLRGATGQVGVNIKPGNNKQILWDVFSQEDLNKSYLQFKVVADVFETPVGNEISKGIPANSELVKKYQTRKYLSLGAAVVSAGVGVYAMSQANKLYDDYKTATDDAEDLHSKVKMYDTIYPIAFAVAGVATINFVIASTKQNKAKKELSFQPMPVQGGGGLAISYTF